MSAETAIQFRLREPTEYFARAQSLALLQAAMNGDMVKATQLAALGADPNEEGPAQANANRLRLLHYAIASNNKSAVQILLKVGADPELNAQHNGSAYLFTVTLNNIEMLSLLLDATPVTALSTKTLTEVVFEAITQGRSGCIKLLLQRGVSIDLADSAGYSIFMRAMNTEDFDLAEQLLDRGAKIDIETPSGASPGYQVQRMLSRYEPGTKTYIQLQRMQHTMAARGVSFPVKSPAEIRAARAH